MSLINDALKQARAQTSQSPAEGPESIPVFNAAPPEPPDRKIGPILIGVALIVGLIFAGSVGALLYFSKNSKKNTKTETVATAVKSAVKARPLKLLAFSADAIEACRKMKPVLDEISRECAGKITVQTISLDDNPGLGDQYAVKSAPTLIYLTMDSKELYRFSGSADKGAILAKIAELATTSSVPAAGAVPESTDGTASRIAASHYGRVVQKAKGATELVKDNVNEREAETDAALTTTKPTTKSKSAATVTPAPRMPPAATPAPTKQAPAPKFKLTGIIGSGSNRMALVNNQILRAGDKLGDCTILSIEATRVMLKQPDGSTTELLINNP